MTNIDTTTVATAAPLTASDRCDRCAAAAQVRAVLPSGFELLFCGHHFTAHRDKLESQGAAVTGGEPVGV
ncbi:putative protein OS=Tsukamurella paurometabola (strain ATCC 8368 / DSM / CCUG 35730 /CIP 100753 / JCM 10117 / KCTC 9821 / NBRC 16120 / NCIMB 702349/ NCTC 13040) OX=521096 GN=Tpau_1840 PE=4 SV=1 [Tsukamurella paurometabola]|uniref:DUF7455 domain-containing protein n=1 Tax=Tsukamurella paurometabola (strain ATCC 8368 / DSM 20162 / CCUG 35730 / CIP 100753 / JCM 10117 / KCTC 9821 / NBRC 16120 / NCIMB 702349 / NCTC 13040) TaxID=521096 RepID=D5UMW1_TSUPD|nr:hypothetical protein [Tsukamurella paurometabola]ADG78458.1 hypothetical protein Tpau_1840 [Tsukamurella paurometabola DSM 20162]SUP31709.1 Uncharacterised protein [Tsukamurella paurometabola]